MNQAIKSFFVAPGVLALVFAGAAPGIASLLAAGRHFPKTKGGRRPEINDARLLLDYRA
jgi:hypothetical protein